MRPRRARLGLGTPDPPLKGWQDGRARDITKIGETTDERRAPATIDLSPLMPPPVQQELSSCVSRALGYGVRDDYTAIERKTKPGYPKYTPSPAFINSQSPAGCPTSCASRRPSSAGAEAAAR